MTAADTPPDVRGSRFLEPLAYESASETANLRWIVRMLSLLMIGHAIGGVAQVVPLAMLGLSTTPLWVPALRLPTVILFVVAAVLMARMQRGAFVALIATYSYEMLLLIAGPVTFMVNQFTSSRSGPSLGVYLRINLLWVGFSALITVLEAVAIIAIVARCRKAGALN